jgi:LPS O-antigen subunit length determinant protein (WzzB/FepE family)
MQYLAEVEKVTKLIGSGRIELKLLAYQQSEKKWCPLSTEEVITVESADEFKVGAVVLVDLNELKQVKQIQNASRSLVYILQSYSGLAQKLKEQEEDRKLWEHTRTYQKQEFARRRTELQNLEQRIVKQKEDFDAKLEKQRQQISFVRQTIEQLKQQVAQDRQDIKRRVIS